MGITDNNKLFTLADMKAAFDAGEFQRIGVEQVYRGERKTHDRPDFETFMSDKYLINVENK